PVRRRRLAGTGRPHHDEASLSHRLRLGHERLRRPAARGAPEEAAVVQAIGRRAVPDIDLRGPETHAAQALGRRHGGGVGPAAAELGDALEEGLPRGHRLALRAVGVVVVLEQARAENLAIPPEAETVRVHGAKLAVDAILPLHARPEYGQRALA